MATPVVFSWSTGKDSAFGLWTLLRDPAYEVRSLLTTITEGYDRVSMSGVREALLDRQAEALGLPMIKVRIPPACSNEVYEQRMASTLAAEVFDGKRRGRGQDHQLTRHGGTVLGDRAHDREWPGLGHNEEAACRGLSLDSDSQCRVQATPRQSEEPRSR